VRTVASISGSLKFQGLVSRLASIVPMIARGRRTDLLDVRALPDHLKRDMGFLDGLPTVKRR
jgi:hypothetical protein